MIAHVPIRDARYSLFVGLLYLGIFLQMLGAPIAFWNLDALEENCVLASLMALVVHSIEPHFVPLSSYLLTPDKSMASYRFLHEDSPFHPPIVPQE